MSCCPLYAQAFPFETVSGAFKPWVRLGDQLSRGVVVLDGEIDLLFSFLGNRHGGNNRIELFCQQGGNHPIPFLLNQYALSIKSFADFYCEINVKAFQRAVSLFPRERWVGAFNANPQRVTGAGNAACQRQHASQPQCC